MDQCTSLFVVEHAGHRALTRLLMTVDGRGASVAGIVTTADAGIALLWTCQPPNRVDHVQAALRRASGVLSVRPARPVTDPGTARHHRIHVAADGVVDVSIGVVVDGTLVHAAGDGPDLVAATVRAVAASHPSWVPPARTWVVADPTDGMPCAVADLEGAVLCARADSPGRAVLSLMLATAPQGLGVAVTAGAPA